MRTLETDRPELAEELNRLLVVKMLTHGDAHNMPLNLEVPAETYDAFQTWLWGAPLTTTTRWRGMLLVREVVH